MQTDNEDDSPHGSDESEARESEWDDHKERSRKKVQQEDVNEGLTFSILKEHIPYEIELHFEDEELYLPSLIPPFFSLILIFLFSYFLSYFVTYILFLYLVISSLN